jgi:hypothetical protein
MATISFTRTIIIRKPPKSNNKSCTEIIPRKSKPIPANIIETILKGGS